MSIIVFFVDILSESIDPNVGARFRAQGAVSDVRVDLDRFYERLLTVPKPVTVERATKESAVAATEIVDGTRADIAGETPEQRTAPTNGFDPALLDRLFSRDKNNTVSLRALPQGETAEADALVALIYGAGKLGNEHQVTGSRLMKAAVQSGLHRVDRIDRALSSQIGQHVTTAGFKKGRRYGLTNPGIQRAEEILTGILG
jgi:hypothetical protein